MIKLINLVKHLCNQILLLNNRRESLSRAFKYDKKFKTHKFEAIGFQNRYTTYGYLCSLYDIFDYSSNLKHKNILKKLCRTLSYLVKNRNNSNQNKKLVHKLLDNIIQIMSNQDINLLSLNNELTQILPK